MPRELVAAPSATSLSSRGSSSSQSNTPFATPPSSPPDTSTMAFPASVSRIPLSVQTPSKPTLIAKFRSGSSSNNANQQQPASPAQSSGSGIRVLGSSSTRRPSQSTNTIASVNGPVAGSSWTDTRSPGGIASSLPSGPPGAFGTSPTAASPAPSLSTSADARIPGMGQPQVQRAPAMKRTTSADGSSRVVAAGKVSATASSSTSSSAAPPPPPQPAATSSSSSAGPRRQRSSSALPRRVGGASPRSVHVPSLPSSTNTSPARTPPLPTTSTFDALLTSSPPHPSSPAIALQQPTPPRPAPLPPTSAQRSGLPFPQQPTSPSRGSAHIDHNAPTSIPSSNRQRTGYHTHTLTGSSDLRLSPPSATSPTLEGVESIESVVDLNDGDDDGYGGGSSVGSHQSPLLNGGSDNQNRASRIPTPTHKSANGTPLGGSPRSPAVGLYEDLAGSSRSSSPGRSGAATPSKSRLPRMAHSSVEEGGGAVSKRRSGGGGQSGEGGGGGGNSGVPAASTDAHTAAASPRADAENATTATTTTTTTTTLPPTSPRLDRKSPGLTIAPPPIPNHHLNAVKAPPIPARNPLRGPGLNRASSRKSIASIRTIRPDPEASSPPPPLPLPKSPPATVPQTSATAPTSPVRSVAQAGRSPTSSPPAAAAAAALLEGNVDLATPPPTESSSTPAAASNDTMMIATPPSLHAAAHAAMSSAPAFNNIAYAPAPLTSMSAPPLSHVGSPVEESTARFPPTERPDFPSVYSQESAPPSAPPCSENVWSVGGAASAPSAPSQLQPPVILDQGSQLHESPIEEDEPLTMLPNDSLRNSLQWGQKRDSGHLRRGSAAVGSEESHVANMGHTTVDLHGKALPGLPAMSPQSAPRAKDGSIPRTPTTPSRPNADQPATRSPSMPQLPVPRTRARGNTESSPKYQRSQTGPAHLRPGQSGHTRPKSMVFPFFPPSPATTSLSKRAHLIREIANTERAHATDLQLIQQAYVGSYIRPDSHHSIGTNGESSNSSGARVDSQHSQRSSSYGTPGSEDTRRTSAAESSTQRVSGHERKSVHERRSGHERRISGHDLTKAFGGLMSPVFRGNSTPRERGNSDRSIEHTPPTGSMASMDTLYPSGSSTAASSLSINTPAQSSPKTPTQSEAAALLTKMGPPVGRPLQPADLKAVFLNITHLAEASNKLADAFERAMGSEEDLLQGSGERGSDHLGEVFSEMLSTIRPLYTYYCARQSTASARLTELMADPATAAYLNDCWLRVKSHTHAWNLDSMLIKPVQRITKYPLLFDDLLSCTSPSHPDYHHIRHAAEGARTLALEIDDAKRRKDVITSVIRKSPSIPSVNKDNKLPGTGGRLLALRRFKKDKSPSMSGTTTPGDSGGMPLDITPYAQSQLKELVNRLEEGEQNVRKVGKEMLEWASATKILLSAEGEVNNDFWKVYSLAGTTANEHPHVKIEAYHNVQKEILATVWTEMNSEVCNSIMLMLGKLLDATKNPMTVIEKLNRKSSEYARYVAFKQAKKTVDRLLLTEASDYVAIHTQLLEELPDFLDGHQKIFEMAMSAFIMTQARFYEGIRDRVQLFAIQYLTMRPIDSASKQERRVSHARGIHRMFYNENSSADKSMQRIGCVNGDLSGRPATVHEAKSPGAASNKSELHPLRHTPSTRSIKSTSRESSESSGTGRTRSMSLVQRDDALSRSGSISAGNSSRLLRRPSQLAQRQDSYSESNRSSGAFSISGGAGNRSTASVPPLDRSRSHSRSDSRLTVLSTDSTEESIGRHSFGLPRIPLEGSGLVFDSFGFSPSKPSTPIYGRHDINGSGQSSPTASTDPTLAALGLVNGSNSDVLTITMKHRSQPNQSSPLSTTTTSSASVLSNEPDASTSWQGSKTLYSCQAVADFNPADHGNRRFQGLQFLSLTTGDLVNVYHEVGRVADLRDFPYTSVGVENDGAVVCCAENGAIGVAMCSFLEPLQA